MLSYSNVVVSDIEFIRELFEKEELTQKDLSILKKLSLPAKEYLVGKTLESIKNKKQNEFFITLASDYITELKEYYCYLMDERRCSALSIEQKVIEREINNLDITDISNIVYPEYVEMFKEYIDNSYNNYSDPFIFIKNICKFMEKVEFNPEKKIFKIPFLFNQFHSDWKDRIKDILINNCNYEDTGDVVENLKLILRDIYRYDTDVFYHILINGYDATSNEFAHIIDLEYAFFVYSLKHYMGIINNIDEFLGSLVL